MNRGTFDASDLVASYAPPNLLSVMPGNKVMLRSGGPEMTVCDVTPNGMAVCQYMGEYKGIAELKQIVISPSCLTCFGAK